MRKRWPDGSETLRQSHQYEMTMAMHLGLQFPMEGGRCFPQSIMATCNQWVPVLYRSDYRCCKTIALSYISHIFMLQSGWKPPKNEFLFGGFVSSVLAVGSCFWLLILKVSKKCGRLKRVSFNYMRRSKQCKSVVLLRDFPAIVHCLDL